jgi:DNA mismatch endonuclease, patch repair protein
MSRIRPVETGIERAFRKLLWAQGLRYRKNFKMKGTPDIVFRKAKVAVFLDSCFWHRCPYHCRMPKSNRSFWQQKLSRNRLRDRSITKRLRYQGWKVIRIWEHSLARRREQCIALVAEALEERTRNGPSRGRDPKGQASGQKRGHASLIHRAARGG